MAIKPLARAAVLVPLLAVFAFAVHAQEPIPPAAATVTPTDSSPAAALLHGRAAAERRSTGRRFTGGFVSGLLLGFLGTGITYIKAGNDDAPLPAMETARLASASPTYSLAYQLGYADRLKAKRKSSALKGGLLGTLILGVAFAAAGDR
jgi:heme/copper-type cytochrome/quinol oxidase subunit 3